MRNAEVRGLRMRGRGHGEAEHRTGRVLTLVNSLCRNHHETAMFEREGKSVATEQGAGVEGCDPAHVYRGSRARVVRGEPLDPRILASAYTPPPVVMRRQGAWSEGIVFDGEDAGAEPHAADVVDLLIARARTGGSGPAGRRGVRWRGPRRWCCGGRSSSLEEVPVDGYGGPFH